MIHNQWWDVKRKEEKFLIYLKKSPFSCTEFLCYLLTFPESSHRNEKKTESFVKILYFVFLYSKYSDHNECRSNELIKYINRDNGLMSFNW